ncbi:NAD(P)H-binding protein [Chitinophaga sp. Cy-1792]|uniref:NmrA family NAD(P)-binding protein n=1 Tax=Chitinophaga sp. Cy-1792 TaxID=2608339 RepID=UPI0014218D6B|nr:NAD(P)H-binding protein [Chitinophaga sp. Cy-1792]NIG53917.1 NAD(P)H-binding protein [Chitinophaga sp. Cy-1792]
MKATITGSLGNISRVLVQQLIAAGHEVNVITSNAERADAIAQLRATPLIGKVDDIDFINNAFQGVDAVYTMVPPNYGTREQIISVGEIYAAAIENNNVPFVVNLSGIGAHLPDGPGPAGANHHNENRFSALAAHVLHLRPGMFYSNFYGFIDLIKQQHIIGNNFDADIVLALSHPQDIAAATFEAMHHRNFHGKSYKYIVSDEVTGKEIAQHLGAAIGNPDLNWVRFPDDAMLQSLVQQGMTAEMATTYVIDMGKALQNGSILKPYFEERTTLSGKIKFDAFAKEFAFAYNEVV